MNWRRSIEDGTGDSAKAGNVSNRHFMNSPGCGGRLGCRHCEEVRVFLCCQAVVVRVHGVPKMSGLLMLASMLVKAEVTLQGLDVVDVELVL
mmetsp:Transcript_31658/g.54589  ORF Transcript_31658/g.54589 Transcript_31658/m.54589 type:complete len:92 (-) Transcript_31658:34-309(-)